MDRLLAKHPTAFFVKTALLPPDVLAREERVIHVVAVTPEPDRTSSGVFTNPEVSREVLAWHESK